MPRTTVNPTSEMAILRRVVDSDQPVLSPDAARAILRLRFSALDKRRMNRLAARNRQGKLKPEEAVELDNYIRVGQTLGILQSKARRSLKAIRGRKPVMNRIEPCWIRSAGSLTIDATTAAFQGDSIRYRFNWTTSSPSNTGARRSWKTWRGAVFTTTNTKGRISRASIR